MSKHVKKSTIINGILIIFLTTALFIGYCGLQKLKEPHFSLDIAKYKQCEEDAKHSEFHRGLAVCAQENDYGGFQSNIIYDDSGEIGLSAEQHSPDWNKKVACISEGLPSIYHIEKISGNFYLLQSGGPNNAGFNSNEPCLDTAPSSTSHLLISPKKNEGNDVR
jgi:hypothetical protein